MASVFQAQSDPQDRELLDLSGIWKEFPNGTIALRGVDFRVRQGTIHGLVGANGAGKSTLFKIVAGVHQPSLGEIRWKGESVEWSGPAAPRAAGISTIYQHIPLVPSLSVLENVFLGDVHGLFRKSSLLRQFDSLSERIGYRLDPEALVARLPVGQRQMVAIMHALNRRAELVLMDEPTASLSQAEAEQLFQTVRRLRERDGVAFVYCSHFLEEVLRLVDVVTVLRDGQVVADERADEITETRLIELMVDREISELERSRARPIDPRAPVLLEVENLRSPGRVEGVSFHAREGEVIGLAGILGSGRSEILHAIFGSDPKASGVVRVRGRVVSRSARAAVRAGLALVPEDRIGQGLIPEWSISQNTSLPDLQDLSWHRMVPLPHAENERARSAVRELGIVTQSVDTRVSALSGGNAQKVLFAKWLYGDRSVLLLDEPTHGVDIGAKADILRLIRSFAAEGKAVVLVSSEFEELLAEAHRILVIHRGRIVAECDPRVTSDEDLLALASGFGIESDSSAVG